MSVCNWIVSNNVECSREVLSRLLGLSLLTQSSRSIQRRESSLDLFCDCKADKNVPVQWVILSWRPWTQLKNRRQVNREVDLSIILRHNVTSGSSRPSQPTMTDLVLECLRTRQNKHWMDHFSLSSSTRNNGSIETFPVNATIPPFTFLLQSSVQCSSASWDALQPIIFIVPQLYIYSPSFAPTQQRPKKTRKSFGSSFYTLNNYPHNRLGLLRSRNPIMLIHI